VSKQKTDRVIDKLPAKSCKFDIGKALALRLNNMLSYEEIAKQLDVSKQAIHQRLKPFLKALEDPQAIQAFERHEPHLISAAKLKLFTQIVDDDTLQKASLNNLGYVYDKLNYVKRLEEDKSTANVLYADVTKKIEDIDKEISDLETRPY
jgi:predicted DNA-binding protein YlxM (UPF0122 family)